LTTEDDGIEVTVRLPGADPARQGFGAHRSCFDAVAAPGVRIERFDAVAAPGVRIEIAEEPVLPRNVAQHLAVAAYAPETGVEPKLEAGDVTVEVIGDDVVITADGPGLRDLARYCLALADPAAPAYQPVILQPGSYPMMADSRRVLFAKTPPSEAAR